MPTSLGSKIYELRRRKGYTLEKLAQLTGSSKSYIWELENKAPPRPSAEKLSKVAEQLDVTLEYLLGLDDSDDALTSAEDVNFFREYKKMDPKTKAKIRNMIEIWQDKDE